MWYEAGSLDECIRYVNVFHVFVHTKLAMSKIWKRCATERCFFSCKHLILDIIILFQWKCCNCDDYDIFNPLQAGGYYDNVYTAMCWPLNEYRENISFLEIPLQNFKQIFAKYFTCRVSPKNNDNDCDFYHYNYPYWRKSNNSRAHLWKSEQLLTNHKSAMTSWNKV